ncbi:MAG: ribonuclease H-like domain-containing protein [Candidatus Woesearchaeota archaeon]
MIRQSFIILPRIGIKQERNIWNQGVLDWVGFLNSEVKGISKQKKAYHNRMIEKARHSLYTFDSEYFARILPSAEHWRLYDFFREECCFLDIETSSVADGFVTMVTIFDGIETKTMVEGINLDFKILKKELQRYKMVVSFNGLTFDQPFLEKQYPGLFPKLPHFDLKTGCGRLGLKGGLKEVERQLGIKRQNRVVEEMYGGDAIKLWRMWRGSGDDCYLKLLVEYNEEDAVNLKRIADYVYLRLKESLLNVYR